ncbi:hypothetical protein [Micromonospora deserti]|nr:hypothetical protein [Micromonospora deserti]
MPLIAIQRIIASEVAGVAFVVAGQPAVRGQPGQAVGSGPGAVPGLLQVRFPDPPPNPAATLTAHLSAGKVRTFRGTRLGGYAYDSLIKQKDAMYLPEPSTALN